MRVQLANGDAVDLGDTETAPTIGIIDYSRRVTDDFGVTTVVKRGFSRTLSTRLQLPFDGVDALQRRLAGLRATSALWIADDRFRWLSVQGFYKDFSLDLAVPPVSFCTLSIEGLAGDDGAADPGGDPAPDATLSTLQLLRPTPVTDAVLLLSSVAEDPQPEWSGVTSYALGARVIRTMTHRVYESAIGANVGRDPVAGDGSWTDVGPTNRWAMFDQALGTTTTGAGSVQVLLEPGTVNALALLDVVGASVRVHAGAYDQTQAVGGGALTFLDLPTDQGPVSVAVTGDGTVSVGTLLVGTIAGLGLTEASPTAAITDYSRKVVDDFGEVTIVQRAWAKRMTAKALIRTDAVDLVADRIAAVRALPSLWIGQAGLDSLTIYGFFKDFSIEVAEGVSKLSLSIEGFSDAAKVEPLKVAWPDITDPAGTKPEDSATNGAPGTSPIGGVRNPDGTLTGAVPAATFVDALAELAQTGDQAGFVAGVKALVDRGRVAQEALFAAQLLGEQRKELTDALTHLNGVPMGAQVTRVERQQIDGDQVLAESIEVVSAGVQTLDGTVTAQVARLDQAIVDGDHAQATHLETVQAQLESTIGGVDSRVSSEVTRLDTAIASGDEAQASALQSTKAELQGGIAGVDGRITSEVARVDKAIADGDGAQASALQSTKAELQGGIAGVDGRVTSEVTRLDNSVAAGDKASADALVSTKAELQGGIAGVDGRVTSEVSRLDSAISTGDQAQASALQSTKAELQGGIAGVDGRVTAEVTRLDSSIAAVDHAQSTALQSVNADLNGRVTSEVTRIDQAIADQESSTATSLATVQSTVDGQTATVEFLMQAVNGEQALAQLSVTIHDNGVAEVTGMKINGQQRSIVFGADLLVVGNSSIFQVDTVTGVVSMNDVVVGRLRANSVDTDALVDHAVTGFVSIDGVSGEIGSDDTTSYSDALTITTHGGVVRIDVNFDVSIIAGKGPQFSVQLLRDGGAISREFLLNYSSSTVIGLPNFFTLVDTPPAGTHTYGLVFGRMTPTSGSGTSAGLNYANGAIYAQEFKK